MAVGRARQNGIEVPGLGVMSAGRFEEHAGSKLHRPNQHTLAPSGKSLQVPLHDHYKHLHQLNSTSTQQLFTASSAPEQAVFQSAFQSIVARVFAPNAIEIECLACRTS